LISKDKKAGNHAGNNSQKYRANNLPLLNGLAAGVSQAGGPSTSYGKCSVWWWMVAQ